MKFLGIMMAGSLLAATALLFQADRAEAQHICASGPGAGEVQVGMTPGGNGLASMPLCNYVDTPSPSTPPQPTGWWETTWGALATDGPKGILGGVTGVASEKEAQAAALSDCRAKGGNCQIEATYYNHCLVLVTGDKLYNTKIAETIEEATRSAMNMCTKADTNCRVHYSACSKPIFHSN